MKCWLGVAAVSLIGCGSRRPDFSAVQVLEGPRGAEVIAASADLVAVQRGGSGGRWFEVVLSSIEARGAQILINSGGL